ncbi:MAG: SPOR domain-containing protein [Muribaculaceae bacterium]|nr:SPOR domain-containing protein [Muribaculaceae bacterium]
MKHSHLKHIIIAGIAAVTIVAVGLAQVNINAPQQLQKPTEKKAETPPPATSNGDDAPKTDAAAPAATEAQGAVGARPAQPTNNSAVNARNNGNPNWADSKKPESLNHDFSTGSSSATPLSKQQIAMRSYGYRILVYQTNKSKNAKNNAQKRARDISIKFPQYHFYFNYKAPTWKLRMGDYADEESAHRALKQMRQAFPIYAKEMTIIHDNINVWK